MTVLLIIATLGTSAAATAGSLGARFSQVARLLSVVDAAGDVTTYLGGVPKILKAAEKIPVEAADIVRRRLGRVNRTRVEGTVADAARKAGNAGKAAEASQETLLVRGHAQSPRLKWRANSDGAIRTVDDAIEIARQNGVEIPDDLLFRKAKSKYFPKDTYGQYLSRTGNDPGKVITWNEFYDQDLDQLLVKIEESVFRSDEAIVAVIGHEMHELNHLRKLFEESGGSMTYRRLHYLINPGIKGNLHDQAWDVADELVMRMRRARD
jgi:hypothetical protein